MLPSLWWWVTPDPDLTGDRWSADPGPAQASKVRKKPGPCRLLEPGVWSEAGSRVKMILTLGRGYSDTASDARSESLLTAVRWRAAPPQPRLSTHSSSDRARLSSHSAHTLLNITNTKMQFLTSSVTSIMQVNHTVTQGRSIWMWSNRDLWKYEVLDWYWFRAPLELAWCYLHSTLGRPRPGSVCPSLWSPAGVKDRVRNPGDSGGRGWGQQGDARE